MLSMRIGDLISIAVITFGLTYILNCVVMLFDMLSNGESDKPEYEQTFKKALRVCFFIAIYGFAYLIFDRSIK